VAHFRVIASEVALRCEFPRDFPRNFRLRATINEAIHVPLPEGGSEPKLFPPGRTIRRALANRTTTPATVTNHLVRCSTSVIISPYVVSRASLLVRRTYLNARYSTSLLQPLPFGISSRHPHTRLNSSAVRKHVYSDNYLRSPSHTTLKYAQVRKKTNQQVNLR
jgi:hypothetical protein